MARRRDANRPNSDIVIIHCSFFYVIIIPSVKQHFSSWLEVKEVLSEIIPFLLSGPWQANIAIHTKNPIYIGIWDNEDVDGSICMIIGLARLMMLHKNCGVYIRSKAWAWLLLMVINVQFSTCRLQLGLFPARALCTFTARMLTTLNSANLAEPYEALTGIWIRHCITPDTMS